jgi:succinyl-CoA synthetase alpha subunit
MADAFNNHTEADVLINFASLRSAYDCTAEALEYQQVIVVNLNVTGLLN